MSLSNIRDLLIIIGIYLYFIAWVYLHAYYESFGISIEMLKLDYSSYLIFSYNVLTSDEFIHFLIWAIIIVVVCFIAYSILFRRLSIYLRKWMLTIRTAVVYGSMVALFPVLFNISKKRALNDYAADRTSSGSRHRIEFIFRKDAGYESSSGKPDSLTGMAAYSKTQLDLLVKDKGKSLRFLGETDAYYIVLRQLQDPDTKMLPEGTVYYIDKKDVLLSRIILPSR
jgi:hypothetical protein